MKFATRRDGTRDGTLVVVSRDLSRMVPAQGIARTLQEAIERWTEVEADLRTLAADLEEGRAQDASPVGEGDLSAPLPRAWQWLDGSAYPSHGELMQKAFGLKPIETDRPLMYQGMSDRFIGPDEDVPLPSEEDGIDFEGEFGVIVGEVPMGCAAADARFHIRLLVQINDWSLRTIAPVEMRTGFGWIQAKPACAMAPVAVTPDELGSAWADGRIGLDLRTELNGERFGDVPGAEAMAHGFHELVAHAARTRTLAAGTIIGSGTVSSPRYAEVGSSCVAERRAIEMVRSGAPVTPFLQFGDRVAMTAHGAGSSAMFGTIDQIVVRSAPSDGGTRRKGPGSGPTGRDRPDRDAPHASGSGPEVVP